MNTIECKLDQMLEDRKTEILQNTINNILNETKSGPVRLRESVVDSDRFLGAATAVFEGGNHRVTVRRERGDVFFMVAA